MTIPGTFVEVRDYLLNSSLFIDRVSCNLLSVSHFIVLTFLCQVEMPGSALLYKEGFVLRKNIMEGPHKKGEPWPRLHCA